MLHECICEAEKEALGKYCNQKRGSKDILSDDETPRLAKLVTQLLRHVGTSGPAHVYKRGAVVGIERSVLGGDGSHMYV